jgi:hypothetical protein
MISSHNHFMRRSDGMRIPWQFAPSANLPGVAMTLLLVIIVGVRSSCDVMVKKPLAILLVE